MYDRRLSFILFNMVIFIFLYLIPLTILIITNTIIYLGLKHMKAKITNEKKAELSQRKIEMERRILKSKILSFILKSKDLFYSKRYYNNCLRFYRYLVTLCNRIFYYSIPWKRNSITTSMVIRLCLFC